VRAAAAPALPSSQKATANSRARTSSATPSSQTPGLLSSRPRRNTAAGCGAAAPVAEARRERCGASAKRLPPQQATESRLQRAGWPAILYRPPTSQLPRSGRRRATGPCPPWVSSPSRAHHPKDQAPPLPVLATKPIRGPIVMCLFLLALNRVSCVSSRSSTAVPFRSLGPSALKGLSWLTARATSRISL